MFYTSSAYFSGTYHTDPKQEKKIRKQFSVVVELTVRELNSESCLSLVEVEGKKKEIVSSRSFSERTIYRTQMLEAISEYTHRSYEKLRAQQTKAKQLTVFLRTSPFSDHQTDCTTAIPRPRLVIK